MRTNRSIFAPLGANNHVEHEYEPHGFYATDPIAIDKLHGSFAIPNNIWEPMCGAGHLSKRLEELGFNVISSDLINRGYGKAGIDFFEQTSCPPDTSILTNPNFKVATETILHSLDLIDEGQYVIMFLKVQFLEGQKRRVELFDKFPPKHIFVFSQRLQCAKDGDFEKYKNGSAVANAWFVWQKGNTDKTTLSWI